ncbi:MAG: flagellar biosynthesis protein FlhA [Pseudomonadales bacterium]
MNFQDIHQRLAPYLNHGLGAPIFLVMILGMLVIPLPPFLLDLLFSFNITLSLVIILAVIYVQRPLDLGVFPTVLLLVTLLRLSLNVASTRIVLLNGHEGTDAAGKVIEAFGEFVIGGNYAIGLVVFAILVIINFVVVTKGAGRVSEVTARFTLDAMPGRQMAIDADLNAGIIDQEEASRRRGEIREEADFFGAMDGASKFVRGDAVAGVLILFINIIGGLAIGTIQHDLDFSTAMRNYTLLTIGDGLVAQIPSLLLSTGTAIVVTRMSSPQDMGEQVLSQLFRQPKVLTVSGGVLTLLGLIPGMPNAVFLLIGAACFAGAWQANRLAARPVAAPEEKPAPERRPPEELGWDDVGPVDALGLEVGYQLIPLVDPDQGGELMTRIRGVRKNLTTELGFLIQPIHIRDDLNLAAGGYRISVHGVPVAEGEIHAGRELAINPGEVSGRPAGIETRDPAFGLPAFWIDPASGDHARTLGYTVVDASTVVATHLSQVIRGHAHQLLGHEEAQQLLERLHGGSGPLKDLIPKTVPLATLVRVLQDLLLEGIPIRNLRTIVETLAEQAPANPDPARLLAAVRIALSDAIVHKINGLAPEIEAFTLDPKLEQILHDSLNHRLSQRDDRERGPQGGSGQAAMTSHTSHLPAPGKSEGLGIEPNLADRIHQALAEQTRRQEMVGHPAVLLVPPAIRAWMARFVRQGIPGLNVLAYNEIPDDKKVRLIGAVGG